MNKVKTENLFIQILIILYKILRFNNIIRPIQSDRRMSVTLLQPPSANDIR